jgi:hypothetical protein
MTKDGQSNTHEKLDLHVSNSSASFSAGALNLEGVALLACLQTASKTEENPRPVVMGSSLQSGPIRASSDPCRPIKSLKNLPTTLFNWSGSGWWRWSRHASFFSRYDNLTDVIPGPLHIRQAHVKERNSR